MAKNYGDTYLYRKYSEYEKQIFDFVMSAEYIEKDTEAFEDIRYDVKRRQISSSLLKVLDSKKVILLTGAKPMSKAFKVFAAKDVKGKGELKVFIDCSGCIYKKDGKYMCNNIDVLIAYLVSAMNTFIYYMDEKRIVMNSSISSTGAECFSVLFTHIVDYIAKISTVPGMKAKCLYLSAMYYLANLLGKDFDNDSVSSIAKRISGLSDREIDIIKIQFEDNSFMNIKFFVETVAKVLKLDKLTLDIVVEKWMYLYGTGTVFGLELYPSFASMITDAYVGCYINNQKTIEKITGRSMVDFTKTILPIGADVV